MRYKIFGLIVDSDIELRMAYTDAEAVKKENPDVYIRKTELPDIEKDMKVQLADAPKYNEEGEPLSLLKKINKDSIVDIVINESLVKTSGGNLIQYQPLPNVNPLQLEINLLVYAMSNIMIQRQMVHLHASAVLESDRVVIICGESGSGKSTLANELLKRGAGFVADDQIPIYMSGGKVMASPAFPVRRLCKDVMLEEKIPEERVAYFPDGQKEKYGVWENARYCSEEKEVSGLFHILPENRNDVFIERLQGPQALRLVNSSLFKRGGYMTYGYTGKLMMEMVMVANNLPLYVVHRPLVGNTVAEIVSSIEKIVKS